ncbi:cysteine hydrolase family protein [Endozoicomonas sp. SCSIO W0465]|uniref:cysteine hydrolase family protein n=1 Tax=Endozoicomonas sp. SCSIO W0465 TaxID=2918516 RepID=UPI002074D143|nr:isochorismatase family protein [Endozoicomonas sp. SCSIO W0465]USE33889.1 isochorismatase family protein [Endozoicomonas sp. SCSIO W0465]
MSDTALLLIDLQYDYFPEGAYPLWHAEEVKERIVTAISQAKAKGILPVHIQHIADPAQGLSPFFNEGTHGADIVADIKAAAPDAPVVIKHYADGFYQTQLEQVLCEHNINKLLVCGMMTQNCVTHTAISKAAEKYEVAIISDLCTTVTELLHLIALHAVSTRMKLVTTSDIF